MKTVWILMAAAVLVAASAAGGKAPISRETESCLECHRTLHPGIVAEWEKSRHAQTTPSAAISVKGPGRKVSSASVPEALRDKAVGCAECHSMRPEAHKDTFEHNDSRIHVVVSPKDCAVCHAEEETQYSGGLMSHAYGNLKGNPVYNLLEHSINALQAADGGRVTYTRSDPLTDAESCYSCHGTRLSVTGRATRESDFGKMDFPVIEGWPNQGVGRINLDGSRGACTACHARHRFSMEIARKPYTCKQCHEGPDVPAFKVYSASKHGNVFSTHQKEWDFTAVPWTPGRDFTAPTCAACHMSMLADGQGGLLAERTHQVKARLPYRIFGLIYAHPHPREGDTTGIRNRGNLALPTDLDGGIAEKHLRNREEMDKAREAMQKVCLGCHDRSWVDGHWSRLENTIRQTNAATLAATRIMQEVWKLGYASGLGTGGNPFDEHVEKTWCDNWLFYANSVRFASAMGCGGDYGVFAHGRYHLSANIQELKDWLEVRKGLKR